MTTPLPEDRVEEVQRYSDEFDEMIRRRHEMGAEKYGPGKFLEVDTMEEALYELADLANYARYTFIKIRLLQAAIVERTRPTFSREPL